MSKHYQIARDILMRMPGMKVTLPGGKKIKVDYPLYMLFTQAPAQPGQRLTTDSWIPVDPLNIEICKHISQQLITIKKTQS